MAEPVRDIMSRILKTYRIKEEVTEDRIKAEWHKLMDTAIARQCEPVRVKGSFLYLRVRNKSWRDELARKHDQLLNLVKKKTNMPELTRIIFLEEE
jgi:predicted nucleic acid-binding Zn ribbon protein